MGSEQFGERGTFCIAQLGELRRHVRHRAVVLADLYSVSHHPGRRSKTCGCERVGNSVGGFLDVSRTVPRSRFDIGDDRVDALTSKRFDGGVSTDRAELPHGRPGKIVVRVPEPVSADRSQLKVFRGAPSPSLT